MSIWYLRFSRYQQEWQSVFYMRSLSPRSRILEVNRSQLSHSQWSSCPTLSHAEARETLTNLRFQGKIDRHPGLPLSEPRARLKAHLQRQGACHSLTRFQPFVLSFISLYILRSPDRKTLLIPKIQIAKVPAPLSPIPPQPSSQADHHSHHVAVYEQTAGGEVRDGIWISDMDYLAHSISTGKHGVKTTHSASSQSLQRTRKALLTSSAGSA